MKFYHHPAQTLVHHIKFPLIKFNPPPAQREVYPKKSSLMIFLSSTSSIGGIAYKIFGYDFSHPFISNWRPTNKISP